MGTEYYAFVLNVRTHVRPESLFQPVQKVLASIDPSAAFLEIHTLAEEVDDSTAAERLTAVLVSALGAIAVLLAGVGIYGLLAYAIVQRRREIGIRMALGAEPAHIARLVGRETLAMAVGGIVCGLAAALAAGPWIRSCSMAFRHGTRSRFRPRRSSWQLLPWEQQRFRSYGPRILNPR